MKEPSYQTNPIQVFDKGRMIRVTWGGCCLYVTKATGMIAPGGMNTFTSRMTMLAAAKAYLSHVKHVAPK